MSSPVQPRRFPSGFLWGAATAAHQVEGDNRHNDWWEAEQAGRLPFRSGDCCRHYQLYEADFDLLQAWGHNCHRFSIEWSRVEPRQGRWNDEAVEHYRRVIRALRARSIEPVVTLHHFTNPAWFSRNGGWLRRDAASLFERYVVRLLNAIGSEVRFWITLNEPTVYVLQGYINGEWPPFERREPFKAARALRSLAAAHRKAYTAIKSRSPGAMVGLAHHALPVEACNPHRVLDRSAARMRDWLLNHLIFRLIGNLDFVGLNYYTRCCVTVTGSGFGRLLGRACAQEHHLHQGPMSDTGWELYPRGLGVVLSQFARFGLPLFITENGIATDDDRRRRTFLLDHVRQIAQALQEGSEVLGYLHWTLMDNFEWDKGTAPKFGLAAVDPLTGTRIPRPSAELYAGICRANEIPGDGQ